MGLEPSAGACTGDEPAGVSGRNTRWRSLGPSPRAWPTNRLPRETEVHAETVKS